MIISGGVNIYPQEIERVIRLVPGVWDCAVVDVPDARFGERPVAFIVAARDHAPGADALIEAVRQRCAAELARYKQPADVRSIESLPRSPTGKLLRARLRALLPDAGTPPAAPR
jgi:fatty-acyl-CoA synthase